MLIPFYKNYVKFCGFVQFPAKSPAKQTFSELSPKFFSQNQKSFGENAALQLDEISRFWAIFGAFYREKSRETYFFGTLDTNLLSFTKYRQSTSRYSSA